MYYKAPVACCRIVQQFRIIVLFYCLALGGASKFGGFCSDARDTTKLLY